MAHNKCLKYSLFWAATATAPISTCTLDATITSVDDGNITIPVVTPCTEGYGLLYNWYAVTDARKITSSDDWIVPTSTNYNTLIIFLGGVTSNTKLKEVSSIYWNTPSNNTNESLFNGRGSGVRKRITGAFADIKVNGFHTATDSPGGAYCYALQIPDNGNAAVVGGVGTEGHKISGLSIRLLYVGVGTPTSYTDNSGNVYRVVTIGTQTWLADNLRDTHFRNGDIIPYHGLNNNNNFTNAEWAALTTAGVCAYNNDVSNVGCDFSFEPTVIVVPEPEENCDIFVPQGFSPSNQDGINDYFRVQNLECYPIHKMSIYDRNGSLLYTRTNNYDTEPWDGKVGGTIVSGVTRTWILEINGAIHSTGSVYVI